MAWIDLVDLPAVGAGLARSAHLRVLEERLSGLDAQLARDEALAAVGMTDPRALSAVIERVAQLRAAEAAGRLGAPVDAVEWRRAMRALLAASRRAA